MGILVAFTVPFFFLFFLFDGEGTVSKHYIFKDICMGKTLASLSDIYLHLVRKYYLILQLDNFLNLS